MSRFTCHVSHVLFFSGHSCEACRWRVCYQRGLPRLVLKDKQYNSFQKQSLQSAVAASVPRHNFSHFQWSSATRDHCCPAGLQPFTFNVLLKKRNKIGDIPLPLLQSDCLAPNISSLQKMSHILEMWNPHKSQRSFRTSEPGRSL